MRPLQSLVVSLLISLVSTFVFSRTGDVPSHLNSSTCRFPRFPPRNFAFPRHARCVLSRPPCNGHSLLLSLAESRILRAAPANTRPKTPLISFYTVQLRTLCAAHFLATLSLYNLWSRPRGVARLLGLHGLPPCPHPSEGVG